jgi:hypothetical protein
LRQNVLGPVQLLIETDKDIVVALPDRGTLFESKAHAVRLDRGLIEAIAVFAPEAPMATKDAPPPQVSVSGSASRLSGRP